jgi:G:T/U-mismatch repair DNA glycosylase
MIPEIWTPNLMVVFVGTVVTELSDTLGFYHLHPRDRFWEMLVVGGITPKHVITAQESKALAEGHRSGSLTDPVRAMFIEKKTEHLLRLGIGLTDLNRRVIVPGDKDPGAKPTGDDVDTFIAKVQERKPRILAFVTGADLFVALFKYRSPEVTGAFGRQPFSIANTEAWLLGSTSARMQEEALVQQEDAFFALGERIQELGGAVRKGP